MVANSIEQVIENLEQIIKENEAQMSPMGYFAALYKKVTEKVRDGILEGYFDDNERMEKLDVVFANRYLTAYHAYQSGEKCSNSWQLAFDASKSPRLIVLQHLFLGMNAHINLDLGIAAAQVAPGDQLASLRGDFMKINGVLDSLVGGVQDELAKIWPLMKLLDLMAGRLDEKLADFSMKIARDGAWVVAEKAALLSGNALEEYVSRHDDIVCRLGLLMSNPGILLKCLLWLIRRQERGSVTDKIGVLNG